MAVLNIRAHRIAALAVASLLSSTAIASAATKVIILSCRSDSGGLVGCDKSTSVVASCPAAGTSCAQAVAVFTSAPHNLQLINVAAIGPAFIVYTLGTVP